MNVLLCLKIVYNLSNILSIKYQYFSNNRKLEIINVKLKKESLDKTFFYLTDNLNIFFIYHKALLYNYYFCTK